MKIKSFKKELEHWWCTYEIDGEEDTICHKDLTELVRIIAKVMAIDDKYKPIFDALECCEKPILKVVK